MTREQLVSTIGCVGSVKCGLEALAELLPAPAAALVTELARQQDEAFQALIAELKEHSAD